MSGAVPRFQSRISTVASRSTLAVIDADVARSLIRSKPTSKIIINSLSQAVLASLSSPDAQDRELARSSQTSRVTGKEQNRSARVFPTRFERGDSNFSFFPTSFPLNLVFFFKTSTTPNSTSLRHLPSPRRPLGPPRPRPQQGPPAPGAQGRLPLRRGAQRSPPRLCLSRRRQRSRSRWQQQHRASQSSLDAVAALLLVRVVFLRRGREGREARLQAPDRG